MDGKGHSQGNVEKRMYRAPLGDRILLDAERHLFSDCLGLVVDLLTDGDSDFGFEAFDNLQLTQKLATLYLAARGLLRPEQPAPKLTAFLEAAVATIYSLAKSQVRQEIDFLSSEDEDTSWRERILQAAREQAISDELPDARCADPSQWEWLIDSLADRVLWDEDYALTATLDAPPGKRDETYDTLGIAEDYYTEIAPDPPADQINLYIDALRGLAS
jgi:hypothetical protein